MRILEIFLIHGSLGSISMKFFEMQSEHAEAHILGLSTKVLRLGLIFLAFFQLFLNFKKIVKNRFLAIFLLESFFLVSCQQFFFQFFVANFPQFLSKKSNPSKARSKNLKSIMKNHIRAKNEKFAQNIFKRILK